MRHEHAKALRAEWEIELKPWAEGGPIPHFVERLLKTLEEWERD
jgi:hypothetical protein